MSNDASQKTNAAGLVLKPNQYGTYRAEMAVGFRWLIQLLDETERRNGLLSSAFDAPVAERLKKAS
jgi:hypothetical protein